MVLKDTPINLIKFLKKSVGYSIDPASQYKTKVGDVMESVKSEITKLDSVAASKISGSSAYNLYQKLKVYQTALASYASGPTQTINQPTYRDVETVCVTSIVVPWTSLKDAPKLRDTVEMPSLIGVRPVFYDDTEDLGASPSYGADEYGFGYSINYLPIKDSGWDTYK